MVPKYPELEAIRIRQVMEFNMREMDALEEIEMPEYLEDEGRSE